MFKKEVMFVISCHLIYISLPYIPAAWIKKKISLGGGGGEEGFRGHRLKAMGVPLLSKWRWELITEETQPSTSFGTNCGCSKWWSIQSSVLLRGHKLLTLHFRLKRCMFQLLSGILKFRKVGDYLLAWYAGQEGAFKGEEFLRGSGEKCSRGLDKAAENVSYSRAWRLWEN